MPEPKPQFCNCGFPEIWARDPHFPVEFDALFNEYLLTFGKKRRWQHTMHYCFWCGGRLPKSTRNQLFTEPAEAEINEVRELFKQVKSVDDIVAVFGDPDEIVETGDWDRDDFSYETKIFKRSFIFRTRWKTLVLQILENHDGSLVFAWAGQYAGTEFASEIQCDRKKPFWKFWG